MKTTKKDSIQSSDPAGFLQASNSMGGEIKTMNARQINQMIQEATSRNRNVYAYAKPGQIRIATPFRIIRAAGENLYTINGTRIFASNYTISEA